MRTLHRHKKHHRYFHKARSLAPLAAALLLANTAANAAPLYTLTDLGGFIGGYNGSSIATAISDNGKVAGYAYVTQSVQHPFLWENGVMTDLGDVPGGTGHSQATGVNNDGQVVVNSYFGYGPAFIWQNGMMNGLGSLSLAGSIGAAHGINDRGQVVVGGQMVERRLFGRTVSGQALAG